MYFIFQMWCLINKCIINFPPLSLVSLGIETTMLRGDVKISDLQGVQEKLWFISEKFSILVPLPRQHWAINIKSQKLSGQYNVNWLHIHITICRRGMGWDGWLGSFLEHPVKASDYDVAPDSSIVRQGDIRRPFPSLHKSVRHLWGLSVTPEEARAATVDY